MRIITFNDAVALTRMARELPERLPEGLPARVKEVTRDYSENGPYYRWSRQDKSDFVIDIRRVANC